MERFAVEGEDETHCLLCGNLIYFELECEISGGGTAVKKILLVLLVQVILFALMVGYLVLDRGDPVWPPKGWKQKEYGSFSPDITYSYDRKYHAVQTLERYENSDNHYIQVTVYENGTDVVVDSFPTERAFDFWGICWEEDSYNIWIQSSDVGTYCMRYADGKWVRVEDYKLRMPAGMIDRFRMRQGSFLHFDAYSGDGVYLAKNNWREDSLDIYDISENVLVFSCPHSQLEDYRGFCWDKNNNLWLRSGNKMFGFRFDGKTWSYDAVLPCPKEVALEYKWDGTPVHSK